MALKTIKGNPRRQVELDVSVYEASLQRLREVWDFFDTMVVSFSGGKDSTVCLELALQVAEERGTLPVKTIFFDEEAIPYQTEDYVRRRLADPRIDLDWYCLPVKHLNACSAEDPWWYCWDPDVPEKWCRPLPPEGITELEGFPLYPRERRLSVPEVNHLLFPPERYGNVGLILGIRTGESLSRYRSVRRSEGVYVTGTAAVGEPNIRKVYPIYDYTTEDVWAFVGRTGCDYNEAYDVLEMEGMGIHAQRCAPPYGSEPMQALHTFKTCFPELWDKMVDRVPGAAAGARYARTELYNMARVDKPADVSWEEWIARYVDQLPPELQGPTAHRIKSFIRRHYERTTDPLLEVTHPLTGISWKFLVMLASRADVKQRKIPPLPAPEVEDKWWEKYNAERDRAEAAGEIPKRRRGARVASPLTRQSTRVKDRRSESQSDEEQA